jgi:hypothetical protein
VQILPPTGEDSTEVEMSEFACKWNAVDVTATIK